MAPLVGNLALIVFIAAAWVVLLYANLPFAIVALNAGLFLASLPSFQTAIFYPLSVSPAARAVVPYLFCALIGLALLGLSSMFVRQSRWLINQWLAERAARREAQAALKKTEVELHAFSRDFEGQLDERTEDLQQTVDSLQLVLYHISHDLRAPLRAMSSFAMLLNESAAGQLTDEGKDYAERIALAAFRLDKLIRDLLDFGRLGYEQFQCGPVDCNEVVSCVLSDLKEEIHFRHARIEFTSSLPFAQANARLLQIVFQQLISNALKFSTPGEPPFVRISSCTDADSLTIAVQDHGIGIDAKYQEKIFGLFEKLPQDLASENTGMGLALARKAVERMGGQIGVKSGPGRGSCFWIRLRRCDRPRTDMSTL